MVKIEEKIIIEKRKFSALTIIFLTALLVAAFFIAPYYPWALMIILVFAIFLMLYTKIEYGLYLMIFFLPVIYWDAYFYQLEIPFISSISFYYQNFRKFIV